MKNSLIAFFCLLMSACSLTAPMYQPSTANSNALQSINNTKLSASDFTSKNKETDNLSLRGGSLVSPYDKSYSKYLTKALEEELKLAGVWDKNANVQISGELIDNQLDISSFSIGTASITAKFLVTRNNTRVYEKEFTAKHEWPSSFMGATAIPAGQINYPVVIQKLFGKLFNDKEFINAVQKS